MHNMEEYFFIAGIALILLGIFITILSVILSGKGRVEYGVVGFIGPFPIGIASSKEMLKLILIVLLLIMISFLIFHIK